MSKADQLGRSAAFNKAGASRSSRRDAFNQSMNGDGTAAVPVTELPVPLISENPDNPRDHLRNLNETVETVRQVGVILPIVVGTVEAYLRDRPDRAGDLEDGAQWVVIDGHRRLEASRRVGLATIPVRVDNSFLATDEALLEAAFIANYHRDDMTDLEEAHALKQLVDRHGSQTKVSERLGIPQNTISSKLSLLKLAPELQKGLMTGERKVEHVRNLGKLSPEEQKAKADQRAEAARKKSEARTAPAVERSAEPADYHGVIIPETTEPGPERPAVTAQPEARQPEGAPVAKAQPDPKDVIPEPRGEGVEDAKEEHEPRRLPYDDPSFITMHLETKMDGDVFGRATRQMAAKCWDKAGVEAGMEVLRGMLADAAQRSPDALLPLLEEYTESAQ